MGNEAGFRYQYEYQIAGNRLNLRSPRHMGLDDIPVPEIISCVLSTDSTSLRFMEKLICNGGKLKFNNASKSVPDGTIRKVNGHKVVVWNREMLTTWNLVIRSQPTTKSPAKTYRVLRTQGYKLKEMKAIPRGQKVRVLARTIFKSTVGEWKNYWYYIAYQDTEMGPGAAYYINENGWVFGEFLK